MSSWKTRYALIKADPEKHDRWKARCRECNRRYRKRVKADAVKNAEHKKKESDYNAKRYAKIKADAVKMTEWRKRQAVNSRKRYAEIKSDPVRYADYLERKRNYRQRKKGKHELKKRDFKEVMKPTKRRKGAATCCACPKWKPNYCPITCERCIATRPMCVYGRGLLNSLRTAKRAKEKKEMGN